VTPARITVGIIIAIGLVADRVLDPWNYARYLVLLVLVLLGLVAFALAFSRPQVDTVAVTLLALLFLGPIAPSLFLRALDVLGVKSRETLFFPYSTRAAWLDSTRATALFWGPPLATTILAYAYRASRARRAPRPAARSMLGWTLLIAGLPAWILLPITLLAFNNDRGEGGVGVALCTPWLIATVASEKFAFKAITRELSRRELACTAAISTGIALITIVLLAAASEDIIGRPWVNSAFWAASDWKLLSWEQLGPHVTVLAVVWLGLGASLGRRWWTWTSTMPSK